MNSEGVSRETTSYGLILEPIEIGTDYQFGGFGDLGGEVLQETGQWIEYLPDGESQLNFGFDPQACVSFGTLSSIEILLRRIYGDIENFSDRFLAKVSLTTPQGNSPQKVAEALRKQGVPRETDWPIMATCDTWEKFYSALPPWLTTLAKEFVAKYSFKHEYVGTSASQLKSALRYSPLGISVSAWKKKNGLYVSDGPNNHWVTLVGYVDGKYWLCFDSYSADGTYLKRLAWDHDFAVAKRYAVNIQVNTQSESWIAYLVRMVRDAFNV